MSERYDCTDPSGRAEGVPAAAAAIRRGEVIVLPTDTVYGIGCDAFDATAVASVLAAKGRGRDMPPPVLIPTARTAQGLATAVPDYAQRLMEKFWPGPLTVVLKAQTSLHWDLGETNGTVALRVPDHEVTLELLGDVGPMAVTSANTTGDPAARTVDEALAMLGESVSVYLDAGPAGDGDPSTIIDCTGEAPVTLRLGAIPQADIDAALLPADDVVAPDDEPEDEPAAEPTSEPVDEPVASADTLDQPVGEPASGPADETVAAGDTVDTVDEWHDVAQDARPDVTADPVEPVEPVEPVDSMDPVGQAEPAARVDPLAPVAESHDVAADVAADVATDERRTDGSTPTQ